MSCLPILGGGGMFWGKIENLFKLKIFSDIQMLMSVCHLEFGGIESCSYIWDLSEYIRPSYLEVPPFAWNVLLLVFIYSTISHHSSLSLNVSSDHTVKSRHFCLSHPCLGLSVCLRIILLWCCFCHWC